MLLCYSDKASEKPKGISARTPRADKALSDALEPNDHVISGHVRVLPGYVLTKLCNRELVFPTLRLGARISSASAWFVIRFKLPLWKNDFSVKTTGG